MRKGIPDILIAFCGLAIFFGALLSTVSKKTYGRFRADRATEPFSYWLMLALQYLIAIICLGLGFMKVTISIDRLIQTVTVPARPVV